MRTETAATTLRDADAIRRLQDEALDGPGATASSMRRAVLAAADGELPASIARYVAKVRERSSEVTQRDVDGLLAEGYSEDVVFEVTVLAAIGAATSILQKTLSAIREA